MQALVSRPAALSTNGDQMTRTSLARTYRLRLVPSPQISDYALAREAARGTMAAMGDLYERHHRRVYSLCLGMTRNTAEAEDLTQEVFVHLVRKIGSFRGESRFTTWLHRLTVNLVLMRFRRWAVRGEQQAGDNAETRIPNPPRYRQSSGSQLVDRMALESALAQLPPGCRSVFVLFDVEGYKHDEIATLLGCSAGTSKSQLHRARRKLRRLLKTADHNGSRIMQRVQGRETSASRQKLAS
jgi:RNA polymerase sigma-70 factor, ECF subfamily